MDVQVIYKVFMDDGTTLELTPAEWAMLYGRDVRNS